MSVIASVGHARAASRIGLVVCAFRVQDNRHVVIAELEHLRGYADAFGVACAQDAVDLDAIGHITE